jgi:redox-sensitive bicupin YhaK (pirin superfamily)
MNNNFFVLFIMTQVRAVERVLRAYPTVEGAGVRLHRAFGSYEVPQFDPFLMLDDFRAQRPEDYLAGFPTHPHRGIETVTYMLKGSVKHKDSMGNAGSVNAGDVQWMTAGSGIIHSEMPKPVNGQMGGFQLWVNLPRSHKMMDPRYQEITHKQIPVVSVLKGVTMRVICGIAEGVKGPVRDIVADPEYLDVSMDPDAVFSHPVKEGYTAIAYVIGGEGTFDPKEGYPVNNRDLVLFGNGSLIGARSSGKGFRFLFFSGKPIHEPVAWRGPIVMNTTEELRQAFREYEEGTFIKKNTRAR